jgi:nucleoside-diphosphate-sugar epimerase
MNILLIGGAGFVDSHLAKKLLSEGNEATCLNNFEYYYDPPIKRKNVEPFDENYPNQPTYPYGVSKLLAEHYCRVFEDLYSLKSVSPRYFTVCESEIGWKPEITVGEGL